MTKRWHVGSERVHGRRDGPGARSSEAGAEHEWVCDVRIRFVQVNGSSNQSMSLSLSTARHSFVIAASAFAPCFRLELPPAATTTKELQAHYSSMRLDE